MPIFVIDENGNYQPARTDSGASLVVLSDELTPSDVGTELGLVADRWWLRGEFVSHPQDERWHRSRPHSHNGWELASRLPEVEPVEKHLVELLERFGPQARRVSELVSDPRIVSIRLSLGHHTNNENPGFSFSDWLLKQVVALGVGLDLDVYVIQDELEGEREPALPFVPARRLGKRP
jgi:hypothetical protein